MGAPKSKPPTSFFPATSTSIGISPRTFLTFSLHPFVTLVWNFKAIPGFSPRLLNLNQEHPLKKLVFRSNPYKIKVTITSLIEMLELPNFGHLTITYSTI